MHMYIYILCLLFLGVSISTPKWMVYKGSPRKWMILWYRHLWKHPYTDNSNKQILADILRYYMILSVGVISG